MTATNEHTGDKIKTGKGDMKKIADNWPWPDPFEERMKKKRELEKISVDTTDTGGKVAPSSQ